MELQGQKGRPWVAARCHRTTSHPQQPPLTTNGFNAEWCPWYCECKSHCWRVCCVSYSNMKNRNNKAVKYIHLLANQHVTGKKWAGYEYPQPTVITTWASRVPPSPIQIYVASAAYTNLMYYHHHHHYHHHGRHQSASSKVFIARLLQTKHM